MAEKTLMQDGVEYYDSIGDKSMADLYRDKIQMMFVKPIVIQEYMLITQEKTATPPRSQPTTAMSITIASNNQDVMQPLITVHSCS